MNLMVFCYVIYDSYNINHICNHLLFVQNLIEIDQIFIRINQWKCTIQVFTFFFRFWIAHLITIELITKETIRSRLFRPTIWTRAST